MKNVLILSAFLSLSGCASMNGQFDCPASKGVSCKSMSEVDAMVSRGYFADKHTNKSSSTRQTSSKIEVVHEDILGKVAPFRTTDKVMRIWMAPFVDSQDNYHSSNYLYTVIQDSAWKGMPASLPEFEK